ncbi:MULTISPECIES: DUF4254 domain-containing protein [unclassified Nocardia]|uniref:DUF4254 domain-containing protein n=1 Tax=unclassified Nocardia TaxID=2637762 RepID=UPI001CE40C59|nr:MULTISPECIES: DUF4254 domain-containing protein [unclassified Nocardia]
MMKTPFPSKNMVLEACAGTVVVPHPILQAAYELASLHEARLGTAVDTTNEIDCARAKLMHDIDCWVSAEKPQPLEAAYLHTESVGMVVDRIAQFSVDAHTALAYGLPESQVHHRWQRLAELAVGYSDLAFEISTGTRALPDLCTPVEGSIEPGKEQ